MINVRMQIGDGSIEDVFTAHKLIYKGSDHRFEAPIKKRDTSSYIEEAGEHTDPRTVQDAFDYKVQFVIDAQDKNLKNVNAIIANFNSKLYIQERGSDIRTYKNVTFYNDFKRVKIVGIPEPIQEAKTLYRTKNGHDCAVVEFLIRVSNPKICDFNLSEQTPKPIRLSITTDGARVFISTSRPLRDGEHICMLTRASKRGLRTGADGTEEVYRSKYRWHVNHTRPLTLGNENELRMTVGGNVPEEREIVTLLDGLMRRVVYSKTKEVAFVPKGFNSQKPLSDSKTFRSFVYGVGVYDTNGIENHKFQRISNICYFYGNWKYASGNVELNLSLEHKKSAL